MNLFLDASTDEFCVMESAMLDVDKACYAVEAYEKLNGFKIRENEIQCVVEDGDIDDFVTIYEEATEDTAKKKKNLLQKAWKAILNAIRKVKEVLFGKKEAPKDPDTEVEVNTGKLKKLDALSKFWSKFKSVIKNPKNQKRMIAAASVAIAAVLAIKVAPKATTKIKKINLFKKKKTVEEIVDTVEKVASQESISPNTDSQATALFKDVTKAAKDGLSFVNSSIAVNVAELKKDQEVVVTQEMADALKRKMQGLEESAGLSDSIFNGLELFEEDSVDDFSDFMELFQESTDPQEMYEYETSCAEIDDMFDGII